MVSPIPEEAHPPHRPMTTSKPSSSVDTAVSTDMSEDDPQHPISLAGLNVKPPPSPAGSVQSVSEDPDAGVSGSAAAGEVPSIPAQKRRRVTRACDECRRKKIKCDGKQPCTHCSAYNYECTYDKPSNRRRNPAPQYIEALESRLHRAETLLRTFIPDVDLSDPNLDPAVQQEFRHRELARAQAKLLGPAQVASPDKEDAQLLSMIESIGQLELDDQGGWDFHGVSSGAVFLRRMKEHFQGLMGPPGTQLPFLPPKPRRQGSRHHDSPGFSTGSAPWNPASTPHIPELPPREYARKLCYYSLNCATCLTRIVHIPSFYETFDRVYEKPYEALTHEERRFLGLLYAVMAVGCMYDNFDNSGPQAAYQETVEQGSRYYDAARHILQDIVECRDLTSLQALLFLIWFLQATSNLSGCYAFVGIALRSAVRMGLHRHLQHEQITVIEQEVRRRVFHVVRQMDIYVSAMLGFPLLLNPEDVDQPYPTEVDDEYITNDGIIQPPPGTISFFEAFNAHTRLMDILSRVIKNVYPLKRVDQSMPSGDGPGTTYRISYASVKKIEEELQQWYIDLPEQWRPSPEGSMEVIRVRHLLRFSYAHVQLLLYRPFLHYVSPRLSVGKHVDELAYACAAAVVSVSRNIVHIGIEIRRQGVLAGPYWFMLYAEYISILSLVFYAVENPEKPGSGDVLIDAKAGRDMIEELKSKSHAAERVAGALDVLFDQLPQRLLQAKAQQISTRKRSASSPKAGSVPSHGHPELQSTLSQRGSEEHARPVSSSLPNGGMGQAPVRGSFENTFGETVFAPHSQEMRPADVGSQTPGSTSSGPSPQPGTHGFPPTHPMYANSPINRLDSLMFPSDDPFAYPNQPMMLAYSRAAPAAVSSGGPGSAHSGVDAPLDAPQYAMAAPFEGMDPHQVTGAATPFFVQQQRPQQPHQVPPGLDPSNMYQDPSSMAGMSEDARRLELAQRAAQMQRPTDYREVERMLAESGYQGNWGNIFGREGYQGM